MKPKTIAVIGASDDESKVGSALMQNLSNFKGKIIPINPNRKMVFGLKAYDNVLNYKGKIDLVVIAIPAKFVAGVLRECGKKNIKNVIVISAGFSEIGNSKAEEELIKIAKRYKINLLGPNCFGVFNPYNNLDTTFSMAKPRKGNMGFISQSGALWSYVADLGVGFSGFVSLGNMAGLGFNDWIEYFSKDKKTKKIVLYIEKIKHGKEFLQACKNSNKKIYVVKAGKSKEGSKAALSHTGSLATDYKIYKGMFEQARVILCDSFFQCFGKSVKKQRIKLSKDLALISNAGGALALINDYLSEKNYNIKKSLDLIGTAKSKDYEKALKKAKNQAIVILTPQSMTDVDEVAKVIIKSRKKPVCVFLGKKSVKKATSMLRKKGIKVFNSLEGFRKSLI